MAWQATFERLVDRLAAKSSESDQELGSVLLLLEANADKSITEPLRARFDAWMTLGSKSGWAKFDSPVQAAESLLRGLPPLVKLATDIAQASARLVAPKESTAEQLGALVDDFLGDWLADFVGELLCAYVAGHYGGGRTMAGTKTSLLAAAATRDFSLLSERLHNAIGEYVSDDVTARLFLRYVARNGLPGPAEAAMETVKNVMAAPGTSGVRVQDPKSGDTLLHMVAKNKALNSWIKVLCASGLLALGADVSAVGEASKTVMQVSVIHDGILFNFLLRCVSTAVSRQAIDAFRGEHLGASAGAGAGGGGGGASADAVAAVSHDVASLRSELADVRSEVREMRSEFSAILLSFGQLLNVAPGSAGAARPVMQRPSRPPGGSSGGGPNRPKGRPESAARKRTSPRAGGGGGTGAGGGGGGSVPAGDAPSQSAAASRPPAKLAPLGGGAAAKPVGGKLEPLGGGGPASRGAPSSHGTRHTTFATSIGDAEDEDNPLSDPFHRESEARAAAAGAGKSNVKGSSAAESSGSGAPSRDSGAAGGAANDSGSGAAAGADAGGSADSSAASRSRSRSRSTGSHSRSRSRSQSTGSRSRSSRSRSPSTDRSRSPSSRSGGSRSPRSGSGSASGAEPGGAEFNDMTPEEMDRFMSQ